MAPNFWKKASKDKDDNKRSRHHTTDSSSSKHHPKPTPEGHEYTDSSTGKQRTILDSAFFRDDTVAPTPAIPRNHHPKDTKPSEHKGSETPSTSHSHHQTKPAHQDRQVKSPTKIQDRTEKSEPKIKFKTAFTKAKDIEMAEKQTRLKSLKPDELKKQQKWAQYKLKVHGVCPQGYKWHEDNNGVDEAGNHLEGYRCSGGGHLVTHQLLAEGKGGCYTRMRLSSAGGPSRSGNQMMPQYPGALSPWMTAYGGGPGFQYSQNYPGAQPFSPQISMPMLRNHATAFSMSHKTWYGPYY